DKIERAGAGSGTLDLDLTVAVEHKIERAGAGRQDGGGYFFESHQFRGKAIIVTIIVAVGQHGTGPHCQRARNGCKHGAVHDDLLTVKNSKSLPSPGCALVTRRTDYVPAHEGAEVNATASIRIPLPQGCAGPSAPENVVV